MKVVFIARFALLMTVIFTPSVGSAKLIKILDQQHFNGDPFITDESYLYQDSMYEFSTTSNLYNQFNDNFGWFDQLGNIVDRREWTLFTEHWLTHRSRWHHSGEYLLKIDMVAMLCNRLRGEGQDGLSHYSKGRFVFGDTVIDKEVLGGDGVALFEEQEVLNSFLVQSNNGLDMRFNYISILGDAEFTPYDAKIIEAQYTVSLYRQIHEVSEPRYLSLVMLTGLLVLMARKNIKS